MGERDLKYHPPWRELGPAGNLGPTYGPKTPEAFSKKIAEHQDWSQKPQGQYGSVLHNYVDAHRGKVPLGELEAYRHVICDEYSIRNAAEMLGLSPSTVATQMKRLRAKAVNWLLSEAEKGKL